MSIKPQFPGSVKPSTDSAQPINKSCAICAHAEFFPDDPGHLRCGALIPFWVRRDIVDYGSWVRPQDGAKCVAFTLKRWLPVNESDPADSAQAIHNLRTADGEIPRAYSREVNQMRREWFESVHRKWLIQEYAAAREESYTEDYWTYSHAARLLKSVLNEMAPDLECAKVDPVTIEQIRNPCELEKPDISRNHRLTDKHGTGEGL